MHTKNPSEPVIVHAPQAERTDRYIPLSTNFSSSPSLFIDTHTDKNDLLGCASIRIHAGTELLESLTCMSISNTCDEDFRRVVNAAYLLLKDGVELMGVARG
jgi:hypothetical protein